MKSSIFMLFCLLIASWLFVIQADSVQSHPFFSAETLSRAWGFLQELLGIGSSRPPAFFIWSEWQAAMGLAYDTLMMSILAIGLAGLIALATFMFAARSIMLDGLAPYGRFAWKSGFFAVRGFYVLSRCLPELVWAMLLILILSPGILPGAIALAIHNMGILGKLSAEIVEGMDTKPLRALRSVGANRLQILAYGVLPQALPHFLTYLLYRWEVIIRTTIVVGFVAAGGLGTEFKISMSHFHYTTVTLLLIWYLLLVISVDIIAGILRRLAK